MKTNSRKKIFFDQNPFFFFFCNFINGQKSIFELEKSLKLPKIFFIYLFWRVFLPGLFLKFLVGCDTLTWNDLKIANVIRMSMTKPSIGSFPARINISIRLNDKCSILATNNLLSFMKSFSSSIGKLSIQIKCFWSSISQLAFFIPEI